MFAKPGAESRKSRRRPCARAMALCCALLSAAVAWNVVARSAGGETPQGSEEVQARRTADLAAQLLLGELSSALNRPVEGVELAKVLDVCRSAARRLTLHLSRGESIIVRCTALAAQRSDNRPDDFERAWLEEADRAMDAGEMPVPVYDVVWQDSACELRHMRAIRFDVHTSPSDLRGAISVRVGIRSPCAAP